MKNRAKQWTRCGAHCHRIVCICSHWIVVCIQNSIHLMNSWIFAIFLHYILSVTIKVHTEWKCNSSRICGWIVWWGGTKGAKSVDCSIKCETKVCLVTDEKRIGEKLKSHYILFTLFRLIVVVMLMHSMCNKWGIIIHTSFLLANTISFLFRPFTKRKCKNAKQHWWCFAYCSLVKPSDCYTAFVIIEEKKWFCISLKCSAVAQQQQ